MFLHELDTLVFGKPGPLERCRILIGQDKSTSTVQSIVVVLLAFLSCLETECYELSCSKAEKVHQSNQ
jgi:hypothetical protein